MFSVYKKIFCIIVLPIILFFFVSCQSKEYSASRLLLGTSVFIRVFEGGTEQALEDIFARVQKIEEEMSVSTDDYEQTVLLDINRQSSLAASTLGLADIDYAKEEHTKVYELSEELATVIKEGLRISQETDGAFDMTIASALRLWGFNSGESLVPSQRELDEALRLVDWSVASVDQNQLRLGIGQSIDVGGIAKGYAADIVKKLLQEQGVKTAILDFGGNIVVFGQKKSKETWKIGIQKPYITDEIVAILSLAEGSVVTSGVYERYFEKDGKEYFHILDPKTGYPADNDLLSVTLVCDTSIQADGFSTGVFVLGLEKGLAFVEGEDNLEAIFITREKTVVLSSGLKDKVELAAEEYSFAAGSL